MSHALVIRPQPVASELVTMLEHEEISAYALPLIEFKENSDVKYLSGHLKKLQPEDWVIAVSQQAVTYANKQLLSESFSWPDNINYAAIGSRTAKKLCEVTQKKVLFPQIEQTSESFLNLTQIKNITTGTCLILRGNNGRELIKEQLQYQGARVSYCETYKKTRSNIDIKQFFSAKYQNIDILIVTSGQQLEYLNKVVEKSFHLWLHTRILYVPSDRIKLRAKQLGFQSIYAVGSASNTDIIAILKKHKKIVGLTK